jgi:hypothetical protein
MQAFRREAAEREKTVFAIDGVATFCEPFFEKMAFLVWSKSNIGDVK